MAVRIAIVEDEKSAARVLEQAIQRYGTENKVSFTIRVWQTRCSSWRNIRRSTTSFIWTFGCPRCPGWKRRGICGRWIAWSC